MAEHSSGSSDRIRFRVSGTYGTPPGSRRGLGVRWVLVLIILGIFAWALRGQIGNLVFARGGSSSRPTGEWVGQMEITGDYDPATHRYANGGDQHVRAVVYMKLAGTDSFMNEYGGPGEVVLQGDPSRRSLHVGALRLQDSGVISGAFDVPGLSVTVTGTFSPGEIRLANKGIPGATFTVVFHPGTHQQFESMLKNLN